MNDIKIKIKTASDHAALDAMVSKLQEFHGKIQELGKAGKPLSDSMKGLVRAATRGTDVRVLADKFKSIRSEYKRLEVEIAQSKAAQSLDALAASVAKIGGSKSSGIKRLIDEMKATIVAGPKNVAAIHAITNAINETRKAAAGLPGADLAVIERDLNSCVNSAAGFRDAMASVNGYNLDTRKMVDNIDLVEEAANNLNLRFGSTENIIVKITSKIPAIGKALEAIGQTKLLIILSGVLTLIKKAYDLTVGWMKASNDLARELNFENAKNSMNAIEESADRINKILELTHEKQQGILNLEKERLGAEKELADAELEIAKTKEKAGVADAQQLAAIDQKYAKLKSSQNENYNKATAENDLKAQDDEIARKEARLKNLENEEKAMRSAANQNASMASDLYESGSVNGVVDYFGAMAASVGSKFGLTSSYEERNEDAKKYEELSNQQNEKANQMADERRKLEVEVEQAKKKRAKDEKLNEAKIAEQKAKEQAEIEAMKKEEENRRNSQQQSFAQQQYDINLTEQESDIAQRQTEENRLADLHQLQATANENAARYKQQMEEASAIKSEAEAYRREDGSFTDGGGHTAEYWANQWNNAQQRYSGARQNWMGAAATSNDYAAQIRARDFEESERKRKQEIEDADFERSTIYNRASGQGKMAMDLQRFREAQKAYEEANTQIEEANSGRINLTTEERQRLGAQREEARGRITSTRESLRDQAMSNAENAASFGMGLMNHKNRLTAMGLGGDVGGWDKKTASNTAKLVEQGRELIEKITHETGTGAAWTM